MKSLRLEIYTRLSLLAFVGGALLSTDVQGDSAYDPTDDLLGAFGSQCSSSGDLANAALAQSGALKGVIASIRDDAACKSLLPLANTIESDLQASLETRGDTDKLQGVVDDLQAAIQTELAKGAAADQTYISALQAERVTRQIELVKAKQDINHNPKIKPADSVRNFYNHSSAFLDGLASNGDCLNKHPNILLQAGAQILKLSSDFVSGLAGSVLLATGGVIDHFVQFVRKYELNKDLKAIMTVRMRHAIGCALEGLAATYCRARDVQLVVNANSQSQAPEACGSLAQGTNLLGRNLGAFSDFVSGIYAGSKASSPATASEKTSVVNLIASLQSLQANTDGTAAKYERNYNSSPDQTGKDAAIRGLIRDLADTIKSNTNSKTVYSGGGYMITSGAIGDAFNADPDCGVITFFYSKGTEKNCDRTSQETSTSNGCELCNKRNHPDWSFPTISEVKATTAKVMAIGSNYVSQQIQLYKQNNPQLALTMSETFGQNQKKAREFLESAKAYLEHLVAEPDGIAKGHMLKTIKLSLQRINDVLKVLDNAAGDPNAKADDVALKLSELLAPSSDTNYIPRELSVIVKQDIDSRVATGKIDKDLAMVLQLSSSDSLAELLNNYGSLEALRNQIRSAKGITKANLDAVGKVFGSNIEDLLVSLQEQSKIDQDAAEDLNLFCVQLSLVPSAPKFDGGDLSKFCKGRKYQSLDQKSESLDFSAMIQQPFEKRACQLYDFFRKAHLRTLGSRAAVAK